MKAWSGCANENLRSRFSGDMLSSSCGELRDFLMLQPYRGMGHRFRPDTGCSVHIIRVDAPDGLLVKGQPQDLF